jgi:UDP-N-acetylmuramoyl-tripeptide--D-alanyl-D-alanine ligase
VAGRVNSTLVTDNLLLIDDSYNANSSSLKAAIDLLMQCTGDKVLIFADMGELGKYAQQEHRCVGEYAAQKGLDMLLTVGYLTQFTEQAFSELSDNQALHFTDKAGLKAYLKPYLQKSSNKKLTILVKGSRSAKMEEIVAFIKQPQIG